MDPDTENIINEVFPVNDVALLKRMLEVVQKDMSDSASPKRTIDLDYILRGEIK